MDIESSSETGWSIGYFSVDVDARGNLTGNSRRNPSAWPCVAHCSLSLFCRTRLKSASRLLKALSHYLLARILIVFITFYSHGL